MKLTLTQYFKTGALSAMLLLGVVTNANAIPMLTFVNAADGTSTATVGLGQTVTFDIMVSGFNQSPANNGVPANTGLLETAKIFFSYDTTRAVSVGTPGVALTTPYEFNPFELPANDTTANTFQFTAAMPIGAPDTPRLGGNFKLASVTFLADAMGTSNLTFLANTVLVDTNFSTFKPGFAITAAAITVVPIPAAVWLLGSGLVGLLGFGRLRRKSNTSVVAA